MSSPSVDTSKCVASSSSSMKEEMEKSSNKKVSTSCAQKVEHCNNDSVSNNTASISRSGINTISDSLGRVDISNDDDDKLFQDPPPKVDCPICLQPIPYIDEIFGVTKAYMACCGKSICSGCMIAARKEMIKGNIKRWCPFCRVPLHKTDAEALKRLKKRAKLGDAQAHLTLGHAYRNGGMGLTQDFNKTIELWRKAAELGSTNAHFNLATAYHNGFYGVEQDIDKALQYWTLSAIGGDETGRHNLGAIEKANGNIDRAYKHWMIAARCGEDDSLKMVGEGYKAGHVTKDEYTNTLRAYQNCRNEMKSRERDIAAAQR